MKSKIGAGTLLIITMVLATIGTAWGQAPEEDDGREEIEGCREIDSLVVREVMVTLCADRRVVVDRNGEREILMAPGTPQGLVEGDGEIWVLTGQRIATALNELSGESVGSTPPREPQPPPAESPEGEPAQEDEEVELPRGRVLESGLGRVVIDLGAAQGLREGDHVEFFAERVTELAGEESMISEEILAVAPVRTVSENRAEVVLGLNEALPADARARPSSRATTATAIAPPRLGSSSRISVTLRPFLALNTLGGGTISNASVAHQFEGPWTVEALFEPLAVGFGRAGNLVAITGTGLVSFDTGIFQIGLGGGITTVNTTAPQYRREGEEGGSLAPAVTQKVRLGAVDGLHLEVMNAFFFVADAFRYGGTTVQGQFPLRILGALDGNAWIVGRGGGSFAGHAFGELGLRVLARGNGGPGSVFFTPTIGGSQIRSGRVVESRPIPGEPDVVIDEEISYGGPMIGFQVEWRP